MHIDTLKFYKYVPVDKPGYKGKFCSQPFDILQIDGDGDVQLCSCQYHMPYTIGNIYQNSLQDIWLSQAADDVRQSVLNENFTYCSWNCSILSHLPDRPSSLPALLDFPKVIKIDMDRSCNLRCPSCRETTIIEKNSQKIDKQIKIFEEITQWALANPLRQLTVVPMASGEIFASHSGLAFLKSLINYPHDNLKLVITTNGTLITKNKELLSNIKHLLTKVSVSIDAATPDTYAIVRGGDWQELIKGLDFLHDTLNVPLNLSFCIQKNNWHEIELSAELAKKYNASIYYQKLLDWGHWTIDWWHDNNVFDRTRPSFDLALEQIRQVVNKYPKISTAAELSKYLKKTNN
jgi:radical SAM protein with 4Fe4S-binding SPASM domain